MMSFGVTIRTCVTVYLHGQCIRGQPPRAYCYIPENIRVRIRKEGAGGEIQLSLALVVVFSEGRPVLDPHVWDGVNPPGFHLPTTTCEKSSLRKETRSLPLGPRGHDLSSNLDQSWPPMGILRFLTLTSTVQTSLGQTRWYISLLSKIIKNCSLLWDVKNKWFYQMAPHFSYGLVFWASGGCLE